MQDEEEMGRNIDDHYIFPFAAPLVLRILSKYKNFKKKFTNTTIGLEFFNHQFREVRTFVKCIEKKTIVNKTHTFPFIC